MRQTKCQKWLRIVIGIIFFSFLIWFGFYTQKVTRKPETNAVVSENNPPSVETIPSSDSNQTVAPTNINISATATKPAELPVSINIKIPFMAQAPFAVWDSLHEDACEEASLLMVKHFYDKTAITSPQSFDDEINSMIKYENENGYGPSITLEQLAEIAKVKFNLTGSVKTATVDAVKAEIASGNPVIVGAAGKVLPNPNFRNDGPNYHMLVIKGYNLNEFITNDPGTKYGADFLYKYSDLMNAIHNWDPDNILNGTKKYLVFN